MSELVDELEISVRTANCLRRAGIVTVAELIGKTGAELLRLPSFGRMSLQEIVEVLAALGLALRDKKIRAARSLTIEIADVAAALLPVLGQAIKDAATVERFDDANRLLAVRREVRAWLAENEAPEQVDRKWKATDAAQRLVQAVEPAVEPEPPPPPRKVRTTLIRAIVWYRNREGRGVSGGPGGWTVEGREQVFSDAGVLDLVNAARRHAGQLEIELKA